MQKRKIKKYLFFILFPAFLFGGYGAKGQNTDALGTYTPYSLYGLGNIEKQGTAVNRAMGGIGTALRSNRYINYMNPASITNRDTLSFMLDFGGDQKNIYSTDGISKTAYNTGNVKSFIFSAPIYKKSALIVGIVPYSNIGYKFENMESDPALVSQYGDIRYRKYGEGSINQLFVGGAMNFLKNFSIGAQYIYYFGSLDRYSNVLFGTDASIRSITTGWDYSLGASSVKAGLQYFREFGEHDEYYVTGGVTYTLGTSLKGDYERYAHAQDGSNTIDTVYSYSVNNAKVKLPHEFSIGATVGKRDKWMFGADYAQQNWKSSAYNDMGGTEFTPQTARSFRVGFEFIPNMYDIRYYFKRVTYRVGAYYDQTYMNFAGNRINAAGFTFGLSLPIYRLYNAFNIAVDFGQRGSTKNNLVRERYVQFVLSISLHDLWFIKHRYQ